MQEIAGFAFVDHVDLGREVLNVGPAHQVVELVPRHFFEQMQPTHVVII